MIKNCFFTLLCYSFLSLIFLNAQTIVLEETFENCPTHSWTAIAASNDQDANDTWQCDNFNGNNYLEMNGFGGGTDEEWLVSPAVNMDLYEEVYFSFWSRNEFSGSDIELYYSTDFSGMATAAALDAATWINLPLDLFDVNASQYVNDAMPHPAIDISFINGNNVHLAFRYVSTNSEAEVWQLDDLYLLADYYANIENDIVQGSQCATLKTSLAQLLREHRNIPYTSSDFDVWDAFYRTDARLNDAGTATIVWDRYSDNPNGVEPYTFNFGEDQDGGIMGEVPEGTVYNREHVFPVSWWGEGVEADTQFTDLHNIFPSDRTVNEMKSNFPLGETNFPTQTSLNGSKIGDNTIGSYGDNIFEPIDEYKGDFARVYLYMATRYQYWMPNWSTINFPYGQAALDGSTHQVFEDWLVQVLLLWHENDPVSDQERARNNAIYTIQHNRNPYIDHPEYVQLIWGNSGGMTCSETALSIDLIDFQIKKEKEKAILYWWAITSNPNDFFEIEHSTDGIIFEKIGAVNAKKRHATAIQNYQFIHFPQKSGKQYYRLKMIGNDGQFDNSTIRSLDWKNDFSSSLKVVFWQGKLMLMEKEGEQWKIWDLEGRSYQ